MTVINPSSISGITSITMPSGDGNVLTIHTNDGTERFRIDSSGNIKVGSACTISQDGDVFFTGVTTATTYAGSGANLTNLPAGNLTGDLPAISGANLTGIAATDNVRTGILDVAGISTFRNTMNVGTAVTISESGIEATGVGITVANINGGQVGGRRNIIINGAMLVAQRATSVQSDNIKTIDRYAAWETSVDETLTQSQISLNSTDTGPYGTGFRKAFRITNGNQTSGASAASRIFTSYTVEARDMANCGWNYTSSSSFITLSFWVRASVAQNYYGYLYNFDGTNLGYSFETGSLSANTWKKVVLKIPGNSNLAFNDDNGQGLYIVLGVYWGTNYTDSGNTMNQWAAWSGSSRTPVNTTTWFTTNDATFDLTGLQLEVGPQATPFEHRSFAEELRLCKRYYQRSTNSSQQTNYTLQSSTWHSADGVHSFNKHNSNYDWSFKYDEMRAVPTLTVYGSSTQGDVHLEQVGVGSKEVDFNSNTVEIREKGIFLRHIEDQSDNNYTSGSGNAYGILAYTLDAEL